MVEYEFLRPWLDMSFIAPVRTQDVDPSFTSILHYKETEFSLQYPYGVQPQNDSPVTTIRKKRRTNPPAPPSAFAETIEMARKQLLASYSFPIHSALPNTEKDECLIDWIKIAESEPHHPLFNTAIQNNSSDTVSLPFHDVTFLIPPKSKFMMSDLSFVSQNPTCLFELESQFDLIVMDPPWPNLSAERSRSYNVMDPYELFHLPIKSLIKQGGYVAVWVTNKPKYLEFVKSKLFPAWGLQFHAEYYWVKVTNTGDLVCNPDSPHKKPYEPLIIGYKSPTSEVENRKTSKTPADNNLAVCEVVLDELPRDSKFLFSIPSRYHSRKPFLWPIFRPYLSDDASRLELFARGLLPGWCSWGNEVLKYNARCFFQNY